MQIAHTAQENVFKMMNRFFYVYLVEKAILPHSNLWMLAYGVYECRWHIDAHRQKSKSKLKDPYKSRAIQTFTSTKHSSNLSALLM